MRQPVSFGFRIFMLIFAVFQRRYACDLFKGVYKITEIIETNHVRYICNAYICGIQKLHSVSYFKLIAICLKSAAALLFEHMAYIGFAVAEFSADLVKSHCAVIFLQIIPYL